ncbi:MAG: flagellar brake protein [Bacillota bacterium]|jgi:c-di-GMP-binding flagellar brake protein YcgR
MDFPAFEEDARIGVRIKGHDESPRFATKVERVSQSGYWIYAPYTDDYRSMIRKGDEIEIAYYHRGAIYHYHSKVTGEAGRRVKLLEISEPVFVGREQRREFVRVPVLLDMVYALDSPHGREFEWENAVAVDISGGGASIFIADPPQWLELGETVKVVLPIGPDGDPFEVSAEIVRIEKPDIPEQPGVNIGVRFIGITDREQTEIVRFVFDRQRELIRKATDPE